MRAVKFDREQAIPIIDAKIFGRERSHRVKLIFDTGSQHTIVDTNLIEEIGYTARDGQSAVSISGPIGDKQDGYLLHIEAVSFFNLRFESLLVGAFDFEHFSHFGAHGILGFNVIKELHLEMNGPDGTLKIF